jgi:hypothetical protein
MEIRCSLREYGPYEPAFSYENEKLKMGRYEGGSVPAQPGDKKWSVAVSIVTEKPLGEYLKEGMSEQEIVEGCVAFLNKKPYRARKLPYGELACRHYIFHKENISASLLTNDRNNKHFWGRGTINKLGVRRKRGRPRKQR